MRRDGLSCDLQCRVFVFVCFALSMGVSGGELTAAGLYLCPEHDGMDWFYSTTHFNDYAIYVCHAAKFTRSN